MAEGPFEYVCNEGNYGLHNILTAARAEEAEIKAAAAKGVVKAPSGMAVTVSIQKNKVA